MISYTITAQKTTGEVVFSRTVSRRATSIAVIGGSTLPGGNDYGENAFAATYTEKTFQNGEIQNGSTETGSASFSAVETSESSSNRREDKVTYQTNGWKSFHNKYDAAGDGGPFGEPGGYFSFQTTEESQYEEEKTDFTYTYKTTAEKTFEVLVATTQTQQFGTTFISTQVSGELTHLTISTVPTTITTGTTSLIEKNITFVDTYETALPVHSSAPRATATVFDQGGFRGLGPFSQPFSEAVWIVTASDLSGAGPWALTDIASSFSKTTALPIYKTSPLKVIDEAIATFPEIPDPVPELTQTITTSTAVDASVKTIWTKGSDSAFPLQSLTINVLNLTTTTQEKTVENFTKNNPALTEEITVIGTASNASAQAKNAGLTYQEFFSKTYTTTRHAGTWSSTYQNNYNGFEFDPRGTAGTIYYTSVTVNSAEGATIFGTNAEQVLMVTFTPCAASHVESSFSEDWGLHGSNGPQPKSKIDAATSLKWESFAEILPGVSVPYPSSYSWNSGNSSFTASIFGNAVSITTSSGAETNASTQSSAYQFSGEDSAHTQQLTGRSFFPNLQNLPDLSFFGPHAATGPVETRAVPGTYVQISQNSLGDYTLNTITLQESIAATISQNVILYPADQSFYTTTEGSAFLIRPRNPIP